MIRKGQIHRKQSARQVTTVCPRRGNCSAPARRLERYDRSYYLSTRVQIVSGLWRKSPMNQRPKIAVRPSDAASLVAQYDQAWVLGPVRDIDGEGLYFEAEYAREDRICRG